MKKRVFAAVFFFFIIILFSCNGRRNILYIPIPDEEYFRTTRKTIELDNIIETKGGYSTENIPDWLRGFLNGGIEEVEKIYSFNGKYVYIGINEGINFSAMNIWADFFSAAQDFSILAAERIERKMITSSYLYPDYEYGMFFETMVKKAYNTIYSGAVKEDTYWIKVKTENENETAEIYNFFVLITIDKMTMQAIITRMIEETMDSVSSTAAQRNAIIRLRQNFFVGF